MKHRSEDVEQVVEVLLHEDYRDGVGDPVTFAERVLDAVAPSLMARAVREFADMFMGETPGLLLDAATCRDLDLMAREFAADLEAQS